MTIDVQEIDMHNCLFIVFRIQFRSSNSVLLAFESLPGGPKDVPLPVDHFSCRLLQEYAGVPPGSTAGFYCSKPWLFVFPPHTPDRISEAGKETGFPKHDR